MRAREITRDTVIVGAALGWGTYEIVIGGGRASVLTFIGGILLALLGVRLDAIRRENGHTEDHAADDKVPR